MQSAYLNLDYYCGKNLECSGDRKNTMCKAQLVSSIEFYLSLKFSNQIFPDFPTQKFASNCGHAEYVPITDEYQQLFLDGHNKLRNEQALGKTGHIFTKTVADMASVVSK